MSQIAENLKNIKAKMAKACIRPSLIKDRTIRDVETVHLVAVSKKQPPDRIEEMLQTGHRLFGENRVQDAIATWTDLKQKYTNIRLHLIGPLQTNKVKEAVKFFDVIETVDREKLVRALAAEMKKQDRHLPCFIQVNTGKEEQKAGVHPGDLPSLLKLANDEGLNIVGLMCIPPVDQPAGLHFAFLKKLAAECELTELSMGMSHDFEKAIPLGATYIRVGTALFGARP